MKELERDVRILKAYAVISTLLILVVLLTAFAGNKNSKFDEIDVKRINVKDDDGKLRLVISNKDRQHPGISEGKVNERKREVAGMLFFDHLGNECGGLIYDENGGNGHFVSLTYDKSLSSETMRLQHMEGETGEYSAGLEILDRPNMPMSKLLQQWDPIFKMPDGAEKDAAVMQMKKQGMDSASRILLTKNRSKTAYLSLADGMGNPRIKMSVAVDGNPKLEFMDESGKVVYSLPQEAKKQK